MDNTVIHLVIKEPGREVASIRHEISRELWLDSSSRALHYALRNMCEQLDRVINYDKDSSY